VVLNGRYLSRNDLQKILQKVEDAAKKEAPSPSSPSIF